MLSKRSRPTTSKQTIMADYNSLLTVTEKYGGPSSSFFNSPRLFTAFTSKGITDTESIMSPTSILDGKPFSVKNPLWSDSITAQAAKTPKPETKPHWDKLNSRGIGLGLVDALIDEKPDPKVLKPETRMVLFGFGSQLKIKIPPLPPSVLLPVDSPKSPGDFGIKTRNSILASLSPVSSPPSSTRKSPYGSSNSGLGNPNSPRVFSGYLSASEMELSEDYTCVISHGPNPKTIHIFDDSIVESCCGVGFTGSRKENGFITNLSVSYPSKSFLSFCYTCKKNLGQGRDVYMYRGEKAFCSSDCHYKEIMEEEGREKSEPADDVYGTCS